MNKRIFAALVAILIICMSVFTGFCAADDGAVKIKNAAYDVKTEKLLITVANTTTEDISDSILMIIDGDGIINSQNFDNVTAAAMDGQVAVRTGAIAAGGEVKISFDAKIDNYAKLAKESNLPRLDVQIQYIFSQTDIDLTVQSNQGEMVEYTDILNEEVTTLGVVKNFLMQTGFSMLGEYWKNIIMILIACVLLYLAIVKQFEPLLLLPIAFGMLLTNLPGADLFHEELFADGHAHWNLFDASNAVTPGLLDFLYLGVKLGIYPCLIFLGVGAMTDFGPLIANPKSLLLGAAAQIGIFATYFAATKIGFTQAQAGSIGIIGGADGPTAIFVTSKLAPELLGPIAVAAYSYMALVPVIQPPIMKALTTKAERSIEMTSLRPVSKTEKIIFPIVVTIFVSLLVPSAGPLVGSLMLGNLAKECGVTERISKTAQNELMNIVTIFLGISVGATATANTFLSLQTIKIIVMGVVAFGVATAGGVLLAKFMNLFLKNKINPLIGSAGVSAVPMAARVSQKVGQEANPKNFLLMHAMGPNVAGVIGSAIAAGVLIAMLG